MATRVFCCNWKTIFPEGTANIETFEKCSFFFKFKSKIPDFERGKAKILTTGIHRVFRGLQFEPDAEIGQKGAFCKGLNIHARQCTQNDTP